MRSLILSLLVICIIAVSFVHAVDIDEAETKREALRRFLQQQADECGDDPSCELVRLHVQDALENDPILTGKINPPDGKLDADPTQPLRVNGQFRHDDL